MGRCRHAVGAPAEIVLVEVHLEDFILRVRTLQLDGRQGFLDLARNRDLVHVKQIARELLSDRGCTFYHPTGLVVLPRCAKHRPGIDAAVLEEAPILIDYEPIRQGPATSEVQTIRKEIADGFLDLEFRPKKEYPKISAIELRRIQD